MIFESAFKSIKNAYQDRYEPEHIRTLATFYWRLLLILAMIVIVAELAYCAQQFSSVQSSISQEAMVQPQSQSGGGGPDKAQLTMLLDNFAQKQTRYDLLKIASSTYTDPSR